MTVRFLKVFCFDVGFISVSFYSAGQKHATSWIARRKDDILYTHKLHESTRLCQQNSLYTGRLDRGLSGRVLLSAPEYTLVEIL